MWNEFTSLSHIREPKTRRIGGIDCIGKREMRHSIVWVLIYSKAALGECWDDARLEHDRRVKKKYLEQMGSNATAVHKTTFG